MKNAHIVFAGSYSGPGSDYTVDACVDCDTDYEQHRVFQDKYDGDAGAGYYWALGSFVVRPGCQVYLYSVSKYTTLLRSGSEWPFNQA